MSFLHLKRRSESIQIITFKCVLELLARTYKLTVKKDEQSTIQQTKTFSYEIFKYCLFLFLVFDGRLQKYQKTAVQIKVILFGKFKSVDVKIPCVSFS